MIRPKICIKIFHKNNIKNLNQILLKEIMALHRQFFSLQIFKIIQRISFYHQINNNSNKSNKSCSKISITSFRNKNKNYNQYNNFHQFNKNSKTCSLVIFSNNKISSSKFSNNISYLINNHNPNNKNNLYHNNNSNSNYNNNNYLNNSNNIFHNKCKPNPFLNNYK